MNKFRIRDVHNDQVAKGRHNISGWVKTHRKSKNMSFIELSDGTSLRGLQLVIEPDLDSYKNIAADISTGSSISVSGELVESPAKGQKYEFQVAEISLVGKADPETYVLQKKGHSLEFLREHLHLRPRTNTFGALARIRSEAAFAVHKFFQKQGFVYVTTPIITSSDCEGAGEQFRVTTFDLDQLPQLDGKVDYSRDFFKAEASLTVSGQLEAEIYATALSNVYTFGPTFRAENSNTTRHLSEFWMIEPEMAFCDLSGDMQVAQEFIVFTIGQILARCREELEFFVKFKLARKDLIESLERVVNSKFETLDYTEAIEILKNSGQNFEFPVEWGVDLQSEHEKFLTDQHIKGPVFVVNYPKEIKAFYMRLNDDGRTVRAMDLLVPQLGEIIGGSQREERHDVLLKKIQEMDLPEENYWWYLELRKYGTVPHAGFGLGFERFLMYVTGMSNIRDVIPFPRYPGFAGI